MEDDELDLPQVMVDSIVESEVIDSAELQAAAAGRIVGSQPMRQWVLAIALLVVITVEGLLLIGAVATHRVSADDAVALAGPLVTPLVTLLGAAFAFYYRDSKA
jgi:hypothetical protein